MMRCCVATPLVSALLLDEMHPKNLYICTAPRVSPQYVPEKSTFMLLAARSLVEERRRRAEEAPRLEFSRRLWRRPVSHALAYAFGLSRGAAIRRALDREMLQERP